MCLLTGNACQDHPEWNHDVSGSSDLVSRGATSLTPAQTSSNDGVEHKFDVLICGTGFDITNKPRFEIKGRDGYQFDEKWAASPTGYLSICLANMPNYFRE